MHGQVGRAAGRVQVVLKLIFLRGIIVGIETYPVHKPEGGGVSSSLRGLPPEQSCDYLPARGRLVSDVYTRLPAGSRTFPVFRKADVSRVMRIGLRCGLPEPDRCNSCPDLLALFAYRFYRKSNGLDLRRIIFQNRWQRYTQGFQ